jgi:hypothetical protein
VIEPFQHPNAKGTGREVADGWTTTKSVFQNRVGTW